MSSDRRKFFKVPPTEPQQTQETRRNQALEEQKRKRSQRIDASRQLEQFAGLSLGLSDDESVDEGEVNGSPKMSGVAQYAAMLHPGDAETPPMSRSPSPYSSTLPKDASTSKAKTKKKRKSKGKKKASNWANKCMYAELLEMREDPIWPDGFNERFHDIQDGLPDDLETSWVGLAPIPIGKRCLAVTMQSGGESGIVPNTMLRSRLLGKVILHPFPLPLPPNTILDCILDENWRKNGVLHVLDVIRWKDQDVGGCEASFRFWWRDMRLSELPTWPLPPPHKSSFSNVDPSKRFEYHFPYPTTLIPIPYLAPTTFERILGELVTSARGGRIVRLKLPMLSPVIKNDEEMDVESSYEKKKWAVEEIQDKDVDISSDGLLLYVGEASYESGESPLSVWVPKALFSGAAYSNEMSPEEDMNVNGDCITQESPLDRFERLIRRRLSVKERKKGQEAIEVEMGEEGA